MKNQSDAYKMNEVVSYVCSIHATNLPLHFLLTSTGGLIIRHIVHVGNLGQTFLTTNLSSTFPAFSFLLNLSPFNVSFVQFILETAVVTVIRIISSGVLKRFGISEGVLVTSGGNLSCGLLFYDSM